MRKEIKIKKIISKTRRVLKFPKGFLWGAGISAYQTEGGISRNDWAVSAKVPAAGLACDHYRRYVEDFAIARKLGHQAIRLSLEWSRIEPEEDQWDENELHHYFDVLQLLKDRGFTTFVTLHHFANPLWIAKQGGWANVKTGEDFADYVGKVAQSLGQFIDFWITVNEPDIYAGSAYVSGIFPPFKKNVLLAWRVLRQMLSAHNRAYEVIHAYYPKARVGFAQNVLALTPFRQSSVLDRTLVRLGNWLSLEFPYRRTRNDFLAVNYYFHKSLKFVLNPAAGFTDTVRPRGEVSDRGWEIYPRGLLEILLRLKQFHLPIYITENGLADARDRKRRAYLTGHLHAVAEAIKKKVDVRGYLHWSLLDNFEWEDGYKWKYGLVEVDFVTQRRRVRKSAKFYARICKTNSLTV